MKKMLTGIGLSLFSIFCMQMVELLNTVVLFYIALVIQIIAIFYILIGYSEK